MAETPSSRRVYNGRLHQSALLFLGEGKSRRDYIFHYAKDKLEAVRKDQMKFRTQPEIPHHNFYNLYHDPAERFADEVRYGLWSGPGFKKLIEDHNAMINKFPHRIQNDYMRDYGESDPGFDPEK